jgi:hypothetical protein
MLSANAVAEALADPWAWRSPSLSLLIPAVALALASPRVVVRVTVSDSVFVSRSRTRLRATVVDSPSFGFQPAPTSSALDDSCRLPSASLTPVDDDRLLARHQRDPSKLPWRAVRLPSSCTVVRSPAAGPRDNAVVRCGRDPVACWTIAGWYCVSHSDVRRPSFIRRP